MSVFQLIGIVFYSITFAKMSVKSYCIKECQPVGGVELQVRYNRSDVERNVKFQTRKERNQ